MNEIKTQVTWRKGKTRIGMMRLPATYSLYRNEKKLATVQESGEDWFWYCDSKNTSGNRTCLEIAKKECKAYILSLNI